MIGVACKRGIDMTKVKKIAKVFLIVLLSLALVIGVGLSILYFNVTAIRFDYTNGARYAVNIPFFCNSLLSDQAYSFSPVLGWGYNEVNVYSEINRPLDAWARHISDDHKDESIDVEYDVENNGDTLKVTFSGTAGDTPVDKEFVFDIKNASPKNLPKWTNRTEADNEFYPL